LPSGTRDEERGIQHLLLAKSNYHRIPQSINPAHFAQDPSELTLQNHNCLQQYHLPKAVSARILQPGGKSLINPCLPLRNNLHKIVNIDQFHQRRDV
jgi:hypothetical protein